MRVRVPEFGESPEGEKILNERIAFLVYCAEEWLKYRKVKLGYFSTSEAEMKPEETQGENFPRAIGWWTWVNNEIVEKVGKENLLSAPIHKAYELHGGVAWQLTEKFTDKPKPTIIKDLKKLLPGNPPLRIVIGLQ